MQILSVALTNFKTHKEKQFDFELGTNAICGENGAGKTSILEAIAWVLFNYQGSYKKDDLIRNGASNAQARVVFISSRDSRTYEVQRATTGGYVIFDPQLNERLPYTRTKDEVLPWLRQHLGVAPNTDLAQLFANTIGIPQGMFTVDFLLPTEKRKPIFDTVLKVEEYRETYKQSNSLRKYSEAQSQRLKDLLEQYAESLESWDKLQANYKQMQGEISTGEEQLKGLEKKIKALTKQRQKLKEEADKMQALTQQIQSLAERIESQTQAKTKVQTALASAQKAASICAGQKSAYDRFLAAESEIESLNKQLQKRKDLIKKQQKQQKAVVQTQNDLSRLEAKLEQFSTAEKDITELEPAIARQTALEKEQNDLQVQTQRFKSVRLQQKALSEQKKRNEAEEAQLKKGISRLESLVKQVEKIPEWEKQQNRLQQQLSRVEAAQQFEQELSAFAKSGEKRQDVYRQRVVETLAELDGWVDEYAALSTEAIAPIKETLFEGGLISKELLDSFNSILEDLSQQVDRSKLQQQQKTLRANLQKAYAYRAEVTGIEAQKAKCDQIVQKRASLQSDLDEVTKQLASEAKVSQSLKQLEKKIQALENPKGKQQLLKKAIQQKDGVKKQYEKLLAAQADVNNASKAIATQLEAFERLDEQMVIQQKSKQEHQTGYLQYIQNQQSAQQLQTITDEAKTIEATLNQLRKEKGTTQEAISKLQQTFDPEAFSALDKQLSEVTSQADQLRGSLPQQQQRFIELNGRIEALKETAKKRDQAQVELKQRDRIRRFVNYARKVYKTAGPRITERYVHNISREADRLFRELLGRQNVALTWSADYEITVQEGAHTRRFINLSGGEQMCAALAVRLALLKVLADIDVAFFDEPTTNMDRPRRTSLAEAIARIKSFKQIFVISHDDTFEQVTETVIQVTRDS